MIVLSAALGSIGGAGGGSPSPLRPEPTPGPHFTAAAAEIGLDFQHYTGSWGAWYMVETMGSGLALADLDGDGRLDLYLAQGSSTPGGEQRRAVNRWYRGAAAGHLTPVPGHAGGGAPEWSMGAVAADYDDDGFTDLYVTNLGRNTLYRNNGDGSLAPVRAGVADPGWGSSAAWADLDGDGRLDLYVANYVDFTWDNHKFCGDPRRNLRAYCHPDVYNAEADRLYRARPDGTFEETGAAAGIADELDGKGLGVTLADYDSDGDLDLYVANDSTRNFLYANNGDATFVEDGLLAGVAFSEDGQAQAGMGTAWGDFDGDGKLDIVVTNLDFENNSLYRNIGDSAFADVSFAAGIGEPSLPLVGFGTNWIDFDNDADLDLFVANGHIIDNILALRGHGSYAQPNHLFINEGGSLRESHDGLGPGMQLVKVSRGSAIGDLDDDGDLDIVVSNNGQQADYLRNDGGSVNGHWLQLRLVGRRSNRYGIGTQVRVLRRGQPALLRQVTAGSSYCSSSDPRLHIGLGSADHVDAEITWPNGESEQLRQLRSDHFYVVHQGRGVIASRPARTPTPSVSAAETRSAAARVVAATSGATIQ